MSDKDRFEKLMRIRTFKDQQKQTKYIKGEPADPKKVAEILKQDSAFLNAVKPEDGKDYKLTDKDIKQIASLIKVPVVKEKIRVVEKRPQIVEKTKIVKEKPIHTIETIREEVKIDLEEMAINTINVIEQLEGDRKIDISAIKGVDERLKKFRSTLPYGGSHGINRITENGVKKWQGTGAIDFGSGFDITTEKGGVSVALDLDEIIGQAFTLQEVTDNGSTTTNSITANSFIKSGGTSSQFLKADGSVDSTSYATETAVFGSLTTDFIPYYDGVDFADSLVSVNTAGIQIGSTPDFAFDRAIKVYDDGVQNASRVSLVGTGDTGYPALEFVTDGNVAKRTLIRHEGEGNNDYGLAFYTTNSLFVSEAMRLSGNGYLGIGTSSPEYGLHLVGDDANSGTMVTERIENSGNPSGFWGYSGRGTPGSESAVQSGDQLFRFIAGGYYGAGTAHNSGEMTFVTSQTFNGSNAGTEFFIALAENGSTSRTERFRITNDGFVGIGTDNPLGIIHASTTGSIDADVLIGATGTGRASLKIDASDGDGAGGDYLHIGQNNDLTAFITNYGGQHLVLQGNGGNVGIGTTSPSAKLHTVSTTEQLRLGYDASNYLSTEIDSAGDVEFTANGTTPQFFFNEGVFTGTDKASSPSTATAVSSFGSFGKQFSFVGGESITDNSRKYTRFGGAHHSNEERPVIAFVVDALSDNTATLIIGGQTSLGYNPTDMQFYTNQGNLSATGTGGGVMRLSFDRGGNTIFNPTGIDSNFRVATLNDDNAFTVDGGNDNAGFGVLSADTSAKVEIASTTQGFLPPRMTTTQKNAISSPATGLVVFDTTLDKLCVKASGGWETITSS